MVAYLIRHHCDLVLHGGMCQILFCLLVLMKIHQLLDVYFVLCEYPNRQKHLLLLVILVDPFPQIDYFHALDSLSLAKEIQKRATKVIRCFVEVNITGEESKHGFRKEDVLPFIQELADLDKIQIVGLMTMAPFGASEEVLHATFRELKELQMTVNEKHLSFAPCTELSMGMSNDFPIAVEEGATFIRIGTALFRDA